MHHSSRSAVRDKSARGAGSKQMPIARSESISTLFAESDDDDDETPFEQDNLLDRAQNSQVDLSPKQMMNYFGVDARKHFFDAFQQVSITMSASAASQS